jgi:hypothetical protein
VSEFFEMVQRHEREWGKEEYKGKPSLMDVMQSPIVVFWKLEKVERPIIGCYEDLATLEKFFVRAIVLNMKSEQQVMRIFSNQKPVKVVDVNITFGEDDEK